jgi:carboxypeptidase Taq
VDAWNTFESRMRELENYGAALGLLAWDEQVNCPPKGRPARGQHRAALAALVHEREIDPAYGDAIETLAADGAELGDVQRAMVRVVKHDRDRSLRIPAELVTALARQSSVANTAWERARRERDFSIFEPELARMLELKIEMADCLADGGSRYDALLDDYEPGMTTAALDPLLGGLRDDLVPFVAEVLDRPAPDRAFLDGPFDRDRQRALTLRVVADFGFDFEAGRQDASPHPFCSGINPTDVRLTTRYHDSLEPGALLSSMHECGHGLYEQGLPLEHAGTAVGHAPSLGAHESQSRFWENIIGRSRPFWERYLPVAREYFPDQLGGVGLDDFVRGVNRVAATPIRVDADEVTYNLHILVRYELERLLIDGDLAVADLPEAWNDRYQAYLGFRPADDAVGVMQDIHWGWGHIGYFPTYTLGNLYAAALADRLAEELDLDGLVRAGEFAPILGWLRERIHRHGRILPADELMRQATGAPLGHEAFMRHLRAKYGALYGIAA